MSWPRKSRFTYSVTQRDTAEFLDANSCARDYLARYDKDSITYTEKARGLVRFFRWLKTVKNIVVAFAVS